MRGLALLASWLVLLPVGFRFPFVGVLLWEWTAFITPNYYVFGFASDLQYNKMVAAITAISLLFSDQPKKIHWDATLVLLLLLLAQGTISYLLAPNNIAAPPIFDRFWKECLLCLLINMMITSRLRLHSILIITVIALGFHAVDAGLKMIVTGGHHHMQGIGGFGDNNQSAIPLLMVLPILSYVSQYSINRIVKYASFGGMVLDVPAIMSTWSRGALIGLAILAIAMVILSRRRIRAMAIVGIGAVMVASLLSVGFVDRMDSIRTADEDGSFLGRVLAWEVSYEIAREHPFFGEGFHGVQDPAIWERYVHKVPVPPGLKGDALPVAKAAHSIYFEVMGDVGFLGFGLWMSLFLLGFYNLQRVIKATRSQPDQRWMYDLAIMLRLSLIVYGVSGAAVSMGWFELFYVTLSLIAVLARFCRQLQRESAAETPRVGFAAAGLLAPVPRPVGGA